MASSEPLRLEHRELIGNLLNQNPGELSEYSFLNLFLFRKRHEYRVVSSKDRFFIKGVTYDNRKYITPLFDIADAGSGVISSLMEGTDYIFPVDEGSLKNYDPRVFTNAFNLDDSDYIYSTADLATLKGHHLQKVRSKEHRFLKEHRFAVSTLAPNTMADARTILDNWQTEHWGSREESDYHPCLEALEMFDLIDLHGLIVYADSRPAGFVIWEERKNAMPVALFEKAENRRYTGVTQFMFSHMSEILKPRFAYFNMCQDMGIQSLRFSKTELHPSRLLHKYRVRSYGA